MSQKILIVEDDEVTALNLKMLLEKQGYDIVSIADTAIQARNKIKIYEPDLILLDISLQEVDDGIELAHHIHDKYAIPFIFLTSHFENDIISEAKTCEPYGYIVKPFDPQSLHATIQMALYKFEEEKKRDEDLNALKSDKDHLEKLLFAKKISDKPIIPFGESYHLDIDLDKVFYKGKMLKLTKKENTFIRLLVAQLGVIVSFEQAVNYVWEDEGATENNVRTLVWRLRKLLPTPIIKNASGIGYYIEA